MQVLPAWLDKADSELSLLWLGITLALIGAQLALRKYAQTRHDWMWIRAVQATIRPFFLLVCLLLLRSGLHLIPGTQVQAFFNQVVSMLLIAAVAWWILAAANSVKDNALRRFDITVADNYHARQVHTRIGVLYRIFSFFLIVLASAFALMTFEVVRALGTSLLAGAGVTGIILGLAAQKTLGAVFAGIQIALTQPIKIDDAVVIEGEWGWIEEITLTYVVVRIWDLRRLIVPITYFVDNPIQNWTRREAEIIGQVVIYADYTLPLEPLRTELSRLLDSTPLWNGKTNVLQVIETSEQTMTVRALMSARNSPTAWDLRCHVREGLIRFLQTSYPHALPRSRIVLSATDQAPELAR